MAVKIDYAAFGQNIRKYRRQQNLTQEILAERTGVCHQFLGHLERGTAIPSLQTLLSICDALGVTANDLVVNCTVHDPNPPCRLRDDNSVFAHTLTDSLFPEEHVPFDMETWLKELPDFDVTLSDPDENLE